MFADSLLESPWADRSRRGWTTILSFTAQALAVGALLALPLFYTEALPKLTQLYSVSAPPPPPGPPPVRQQMQNRNPVPSNLRDGRLMEIESIPHGVRPIVDAGPISDSDPDAGPWFSAATSPGGPSVLNSLMGSGHPAMPAQPVPTARPPIVSRIMEGNLICRVEPKYPPLAHSARVQGTVELQAIISRTGTIENLQVISGHPMLVAAAVDAVRQWRYRPYLLNGAPVEVETRVTVNFTLTGN
jgi:protein TonB